MTDAPELEDIVERLLAGTPVRVLEGLYGAVAGGREALDAARETLGLVGASVTPVAPSEGLRGRLAAHLSANPLRAPRRALVVVDMLVDYLTPGRALFQPRAAAIVDALEARLAAARRSGEPVIYLVDHHPEGDPELEVWPHHNNAEDPASQVWPSLAPGPGDTLVTHRAYSGFFETTLDATLRAMAVDTLELTGCLTELQLFVTATDALQRGFRVELPPRLQAGSSPVAEQVALTVLSAMPPVAPFEGPR
ncbi:MAG: cysteine hydrolase [Myxococcales bacterium]|nr:cysteine hydrolase [Myxococcales bacterium]